VQNSKETWGAGWTSETDLWAFHLEERTGACLTKGQERASEEGMARSEAQKEQGARMPCWGHLGDTSSRDWLSLPPPAVGSVVSSSVSRMRKVCLRRDRDP
jgi:hypothetical protein